MISAHFGVATTIMLASAILHALVGVIMKASSDRLVFRSVLSTVSAVILLPFVFVFPFPAQETWGYLAVGLSVHFIYQVTMVGAFNRGDMSLVYPIMRGGAPALAGLFAYFILEETLSPIQASGLGLSVFALIAFGWPDKGIDMPERKNRWSAIGLALICAVMVALYTTIDTAGLRLSREFDGVIWGYLVWLFILDCIGITTLTILLRRRAWIKSYTSQFKHGGVAAIISIFGFGGAMYALSIAPVAQMSALRETSIVFGAVLAYFLLKEPFGRRRIGLAVILAFGLVVLQFG